jgi:hypothetical protein
MNKLSTLTLIISLIFASPALAEPPAGLYMPQIALIVCDTREQIGQVLDAVKNDTVKDKLIEFGKQLDTGGEPICLYSLIGPFTVDSNEHIGIITSNDHTVDMWILKVHNSLGSFYVLWGELGEDTET